MNFKRIIVVIIFLLLLLLTISCESEPELAGPPLEGEITDLASEFIDNLKREDYSGAVAFFNKEMKNAMSERDLEQAWQVIIGETGPYTGEVEKYIMFMSRVVY